jgi:hypothetical protein
MNRCRRVLQMSLGGGVFCTFIGMFAGGVLGCIFGCLTGNISLGLDYALIGGGVSFLVGLIGGAGLAIKEGPPLKQFKQGDLETFARWESEQKSLTQNSAESVSAAGKLLSRPASRGARASQVKEHARESPRR